jgi:hypothetical protein
MSAFGHGDLRTSLILVFPLFLAYQIGVMFSPTINGVDFMTRVMYGAMGSDRDNYLALQLVLAVTFVLYVTAQRERGRFTFRGIVPLVAESALYAITLGTLIVLIMQKLLGLELAIRLGATGQAIVISLGAGVHEELIFRLGAMAGGMAVLSRVGIDSRIAMLVALFGSAILFSGAHHIGTHGDVLDTSVFTYRMLAGVAFGLIFYYRSLAHAVYAHFLYDVYVLVIRS